VLSIKFYITADESRISSGKLNDIRLSWGRERRHYTSKRKAIILITTSAVAISVQEVLTFMIEYPLLGSKND
jgi:hypothetical protein